MPKVTPKGNTESAKGKGKGAQVFFLVPASSKKSKFKRKNMN